MRKLKYILLAAVMLFSVMPFTGCGETDKKDSDKLSIVTTVFPSYDFAKQIAGDKADVTLLLKPGAESHSYEPTTSDIVTISKCDIFICVGSVAETWVDNVLESINNKNIKVIELMDCVDLLKTEHIEEDEESHEDEEDHDEYDEHVWTSPANSVTLAEDIRDAIIENDKANAETYKANADSYISKINEVDAEFKDIVDNAARKTIVFGDRYPLIYFSTEYGLEYHAAFSGCSEETEPGPVTMANLISEVNEEKIPVVFYLEFSSEKVAKTISDSTGAKIMQFHSCHNVSAEDLENGVTYVDLMKRNAENLKEALG